MYSDIIKHVEPEREPKVNLKDESFSVTCNIQVQYRHVYEENSLTRTDTLALKIKIWSINKICLT